ncbi:voltage-dependent T-type calcium channel subunit alpha-1H-like isoform X2 [Perca flavescens]|uniref:voltage-dependent T-type calcium channel subunit alpha-1H-like isoform X2 n=1 Tax=Perca flavescens TaxID=8167 RepID=UPI00106E5062|nr:voltage-dependent T-type calcium channel subunit alpha-1H-like isoform X2 [Perca flavescens]XP_028442757.1 voltage-dependent T-type calcium channel subunit alpha-1H-like isoform X2 [Perca flavescens]
MLSFTAPINFTEIYLILLWKTGKDGLVLVYLCLNFIMTDFEGQKEEQRRQEVAITLPEQGVPNPHCVSTQEEQLPYPALAPVVFHCLKQTTRLRNWCLQVAYSPWLNYVSVPMIVFSCVSLSYYKPSAPKNTVQEIVDASVFVYFIVEMLIKMAGLGVFGYKGSYFSNNWYRLDFIINCGEMLDYIFLAFGIHLKFCQVFGPLRLISRVPSMLDVVTVLLGTMPMLANVMVLYIFVIQIFAVVGVQLWAGQLRNRCFLGEDILTKYNVSLNPYYMGKYGEKYPFLCSPGDKLGMQHCHDVPPYRNNGKNCSLAAHQYASAVDGLVSTVAGASANACVNWNMYYNVCRPGDHNPYMGTISFDNIGYAWITIFQVVTLEGWAEIMFFIMDVYSWWSVLFFVPVTVMGSFIMMNVCAVVIANQFSESMKQDTPEQSVGAVAIAWLCGKLTGWMQGIYRKYRQHNRVRPHGGSRRIDDSLMFQVWSPFMKTLQRIVNSKLFDRLVKFAVFLSIVTMAIEHYDQPNVLTDVLQISNIVFTIIFVVELVIKLLALTWTYFRDWNNIFDFLIAIISLWELISKADGRLSVLRAFRLLRFVRLLHFLPYLKRQLLVLKRTMTEAATLCMLLLFVIFIFSIVGIHLFGGKFYYETQHGDVIIERRNFDTLLWAMVTVFQILTQEDWNLVMYNAMANSSQWACIYFVVVIILGKHVLLNILVGIVVQSFQARHISSIDQDSSLPSCESTSSTPEILMPENTAQTDNNNRNGPSGPNQGLSLSACWPSRFNVINAAPGEDSAPTDTNGDNRCLNLIRKMVSWCKEHEEWSFYVFSPQNKFRICCQHLISHKMFDHMVLVFILLSCATIAMERPEINPESTERWILDMSGYVFSAVFFVEMLFKVIALGLLFGKESYCRSAWNAVDGFLVILSLVDILVSLAITSETNMLGILKVLRLLRTMRPLRVIKRAPKLKLAVKALLASVKPIGNIVLICCAFLFFYGILGVQLFKGKFFYCLGHDTRNITNKTECLSANYRWVQKVYNFDSLPQALMSLFVMYSKDGWVNIMYDGLDAVGVDEQPITNYNEWILVFFITFMVMSFFLLDMFIGVMVETFHQCQQDQKKVDNALPQEAVVSQGQCIEPEQIPYYTYYSPIRRSIHTFCTSKFLDLFMAAIIFLSVLMMSFQHYDQPLYVGKITDYSYYVFTVILIIEVLLKLVAFGILRFIQSRWNLLDVAVVLISIISIVLHEMDMAHSIPINPSILRVCRVLRLAQVLKAKKIRVLLKTIMKTLSQVGNICLLFAFFFFIYAALGVELFGRLECTDDNICLGLHRYANFRHFGLALLTLYEVCTGDNWSVIMADTLRECRPDDDGCLSYLSWVSPIFFSSFVVTAQFVLVNLVVAAIMQALDDSHEECPLEINTSL